MAVESTAAGSVVSIVYIHDTVVCVSSSIQCIQHARPRLNVAAGVFMTIVSIVSVVCIVNVI